MALEAVGAVIEQIVSAINGLGNLFTTGQTIHSSILGLIAAHPYLAAGVAAVVLVAYAPEIINSIANWIARLRRSWDRLKQSVRLDVEQLERFLGM
jgi:hypothetical protein